MSNLQGWILSYLFNSLWQVPLLCAAGWMMARLLRNGGVEVEHRVWVVTLLLQSVLPAFSAMPWRTIRSLWNWRGDNLGQSDARVSVLFSNGSPLDGIHVPALLLTVFAIAYVLVCMYFLARFVWRCRQTVLLKRDSIEIAMSKETEDIWQRCSMQFGAETASLGASSRVFSPVTLGIGKKLVLLPADLLAQLPDQELNTILAHEFAHVRRNDFVKNLIYECLSLPMCYHPLFWRTRDRMVESREMVCDAMAAQVAGYDQYALSLLRLASLLIAGVPIRTPHTIGIFDANILERRLMRLKQTQDQFGAVRRAFTIVACLLIGGSVCASAVALARNADGVVTRAEDSPKVKGRQTIPAGEMEKYVIHKVPPAYPKEAKEARIQGKVELHAVIGVEGEVEMLKVISGPERLQQSALDAVRQWRYKPFLLNGEPTEVETTINVTYSLGK